MPTNSGEDAIDKEDGGTTCMLAFSLMHFYAVYPAKRASQSEFSVRNFLGSHLLIAEFVKSISPLSCQEMIILRLVTLIPFLYTLPCKCRGCDLITG
jgi:hypothetical protein